MSSITATQLFQGRELASAAGQLPRKGPREGSGFALSATVHGDAVECLKDQQRPESSVPVGTLMVSNLVVISPT